MAKIHDDVIRIIESLVSSFTGGELPYRYRLAINELKKKIYATGEAQLVMTLMDIDKEIKNILYADNVEDPEDLAGKWLEMPNWRLDIFCFPNGMIAVTDRKYYN